METERPVFHISPPSQREEKKREKKKKRRRRKPVDNFLETHLTWSLWRLQLWKMKISSLVFALLTRALFGGRNIGFGMLGFFPPQLLLELTW